MSYETVELTARWKPTKFIHDKIHFILEIILILTGVLETCTKTTQQRPHTADTQTVSNICILHTVTVNILSITPTFSREQNNRLQN